MKLTQQDLAAKINITHQAISKWERGESLPDLESLYLVSLVFQTTMDNIITMSKNSNELLLENSSESLLQLNEENIQNIWNEVLSILKSEVAKPSFDTWLKNTKASIVDDQNMIIHSSTPMQSIWVEQRYQSRIRNTIAQVLGISNFSLNIIFEPKISEQGTGNNYVVPYLR